MTRASTIGNADVDCDAICGVGGVAKKRFVYISGDSPQQVIVQAQQRRRESGIHRIFCAFFACKNISGSVAQEYTVSIHTFHLPSGLTALCPAGTLRKSFWHQASAAAPLRRIVLQFVKMKLQGLLACLRWIVGELL